jgi:hypothetical protein
MRIFLSLILLFVFSICYSQVLNTPVCVEILTSTQDTNKTSILTLSSAVPSISCVYNVSQSVKLEFCDNYFILPDSCSEVKPLTSKKSNISNRINTNKK